MLSCLGFSRHRRAVPEGTSKISKPHICCGVALGSQFAFLSLAYFLPLARCGFASTMVILPLATGLPQPEHHDGAAAGMEDDQDLQPGTSCVLITHCSTEWALVPSPSGYSLDTGFHDKRQQPVNCAGEGSADCSIWAMASHSQSPLGSIT